MVVLSRKLLLLLLVLGSVLGQEEEEEAGAEEAEECVPCEEAWEYVEFLKTEINVPVTEMLQDFKNSGTAEQTVSETMNVVMDIREVILTRIKAIRKAEDSVVICPEQNIKQEEKLSEFRMEIMSILLKLVESEAASNLKDISSQLLKFRSSITGEVMRLLMLPQPKCGEEKAKPQGDCSDCEVLSTLHSTLQNLQVCASKKDGEEPEEAAEEEQAAEDEEQPGENCEEPPMYAMTLILANEELDKAIADLYNQIISTTEEEERKKALDMLTVLKEFREDIEESISKLLELGDEKEDEEQETARQEKLKKQVSRDLRVQVINVKSKLDECNEQCGGDSGCSSCAGPVLEDAIDKMDQYLESLNSDREEDEKKDFIRGDLITHINKINEDSRNIVILKVESETGELDQCDKDKQEIYERIKGPMWMLVNTTIFSEMGEIQTMVESSKAMLQELLGQKCANADVPAPLESDEGPQCDWEEYEQTKEYLVEVDNTIQEGLFKASDDSAKTTALLGFVKIQEMFDKRVKKLFEEEVKCPEELTMIKKEYMGVLQKCMIEFMNPKVKFSEMSRLQRISCIKGLRNMMEDRTAALLQAELEKSLSSIQEGEDA